MTEFIRIPANASSISRRKPVYGIGINDADYIVQPTVSGKHLRCLFYTKWKGMLERCYSLKYQHKEPTYIGCTVCDEWIYFSNFKKWMELQDWKNKELDKDLKILGNKIYSPNNCLFIEKSLNSLFNDNKAIRGKYPKGVSFYKDYKMFQSKICIKGKAKYLGVFNNARSAELAYIKAKNKEIIRQSNLEENKDIKEYFIQHIILT